jgi:hypothetical protein
VRSQALLGLYNSLSQPPPLSPPPWAERHTAKAPPPAHRPAEPVAPNTPRLAILEELRRAVREAVADAGAAGAACADADVPGRVLDAVGWEVDLTQQGRSERVLRSVRASLPPLLLRLLQSTTFNPGGAANAAATPVWRADERDAPGAGRHHGRQFIAPPPSVVGELLSDHEPQGAQARTALAGTAAASWRPQTPWALDNEPPGSKPVIERPRAKTAWAAVPDTRESYPMPPPRAGINGGMPGVY